MIIMKRVHHVFENKSYLQAKQRNGDDTKKKIAE